MKNNFSTILSERLITITKISKETGISRSTLTNFYYRKRQNFELGTLKTICDYLQIPLSELVEYVPTLNNI